MEAPPAKKAKVSPTLLSMVVEEWEDSQIQQYSQAWPISRNSTCLWTLRLYNKGAKMRLSVYSEMSEVAELWERTANITVTTNTTPTECQHTFTSWDEDSHEVVVLEDEFAVGSKIEVEITPTFDGDELWRRYPVLCPFDPRDGILVVGEEKKSIHVNKKSLASQSLYFDRLFNGDFNGANITEFPIGHVKYEDMVNFLNRIYGFKAKPVSDANVLDLLMLANRFECKIVEDKVVSYLLSSSCSFSILEKLLFSEKNNLPFATKVLRSQDYSNDELKKLCKSPQSEQLSKETILILFEKSLP